MKIGNVECYGIIYKITNLLNNKVYIGQSTRGFKRRYCHEGNGVERVFKYYKSRKKTNKHYNDHLLKSITKYGFEAFEVIEIYDIAFSQVELDIKEKTYIKLFNSHIRKYGYNFTEGGGNGKRSIETRHKLSEARKGYRWSEEEKIRMSKQRKGISHYNNKTDEEKAIWRKNMSLAKLGKHLREKNANAKKVVCLNDRKVFNTILDAEEFYNIKSSCHIGECCLGKFNYAGKYNGEKLVWKFYNDYINMTEKEINNLVSKSKRRYNCKGVICLNTKRIFYQVKEGARFYNIDDSGITKCCKGKATFCGTYNDEKLIWRYLNYKHNKIYRFKN